MFAGVAPKYDFLNHLLSFRIDRNWRKALKNCLTPILIRPDARILDLCCGTGDVLLDLQSGGPAAVMGADFCYPMLVAAQAKIERQNLSSSLFEADALDLPVRSDTFDAIAIAFGFRNLANYQAGLRELHRVLKPGGRLAILEFSHPPGWLVRTGYGLYSRFILPVIGGLISGSRDAYTYLPDSIRKFPDANRLAGMMSAAGFQPATYQFLTGGIAALHIGEKQISVQPR